MQLLLVFLGIVAVLLLMFKVIGPYFERSGIRQARRAAARAKLPYGDEPHRCDQPLDVRGGRIDSATGKSERPLSSS